MWSLGCWLRQIQLWVLLLLLAYLGWPLIDSFTCLDLSFSALRKETLHWSDVSSLLSWSHPWFSDGTIMGHGRQAAQLTFSSSTISPSFALLACWVYSRRVTPWSKTLTFEMMQLNWGILTAPCCEDTYSPCLISLGALVLPVANQFSLTKLSPAPPNVIHLPRKLTSSLEPKPWLHKTRQGSAIVIYMKARISMKSYFLKRKLLILKIDH